MRKLNEACKLLKAYAKDEVSLVSHESSNWSKDRSYTRHVGLVNFLPSRTFCYLDVEKHLSNKKINCIAKGITKKNQRYQRSTSYKLKFVFI